MSATRGKGRANPKRSLDNSKSEDDVLDEEEEDDDVVPVKRANKGAAGKRGGGRGAAKQPVVQQPEEDDDDLDDDLDEDDEELGEEEEEEDDEEGSDPGDSDESNPDEPPREFGPRSFVVLKTDFDQGGDPPLWRIDGNSLLQKYTPFKDKDGGIFYKSTSVYSGWSINNKDSYYSAAVVFKRQEKNDTVVHFDKAQIKSDKKGEK